MSGSFSLPHSKENIFNDIHILIYYFVCTVNNTEHIRKHRRGKNGSDFLQTTGRNVMWYQFPPQIKQKFKAPWIHDLRNLLLTLKAHQREVNHSPPWDLNYLWIDCLFHKWAPNSLEIENPKLLTLYLKEQEHSDNVMCMIILLLLRICI